MWTKRGLFHTCSCSANPHVTAAGAAAADSSQVFQKKEGSQSHRQRDQVQAGLPRSLLACLTSALPRGLLAGLTRALPELASLATGCLQPCQEACLPDYRLSSLAKGLAHLKRALPRGWLSSPQAVQPCQEACLPEMSLAPRGLLD